MVEIIDYDDRYFDEFRALNLEWLELHQLTEPYDLEVLNNPRKKIIDAGGYIFLARDGESIVGTAGIAKMDEGVYEVIKMSVAPAMRGHGIGKILMDSCLQKAKQINAAKIILYSSSKLPTAIKMYEKFGFTHVALINSPFVTADVKMELSL